MEEFSVPRANIYLVKYQAEGECISTPVKYFIPIDLGCSVWIYIFPNLTLINYDDTEPKDLS